MEKVVLILSGGMDSTTLLYKLAAEGYDVYAISFNYGQRHNRELTVARRTCEKIGVKHRIVNVSGLKYLLEGSSLTSDIEVPEGHYADENMKKTVVPNRNMIMLSIATGYAVSIGAGKVFFGAHSGDHAIYPDCRKVFVAALNAVTKVANYQPIEVIAPFLELDKGDIAILGKRLGVDYSLTHTCYKGKKVACGKCGACTERLEAFKKAGIEDPIKYEVS